MSPFSVSTCATPRRASGAGAGAYHNKIEAVDDRVRRVPVGEREHEGLAAQVQRPGDGLDAVVTPPLCGGQRRDIPSIACAVHIVAAVQGAHFEADAIT